MWHEDGCQYYLNFVLGRHLNGRWSNVIHLPIWKSQHNIFRCILVILTNGTVSAPHGNSTLIKGGIWPQRKNFSCSFVKYSNEEPELMTFITTETLLCPWVKCWSDLFEADETHDFYCPWTISSQLQRVTTTNWYKWIGSFDISGSWTGSFFISKFPLEFYVEYTPVY